MLFRDFGKNKFVALIIPFAFKLYIVWSVIADITLITGILWLIFT